MHAYFVKKKKKKMRYIKMLYLTQAVLIIVKIEIRFTIECSFFKELLGCVAWICESFRLNSEIMLVK